VDGGNLPMAIFVIPESLAPTFVKQFHEGTHSGQTALETTLAQHFYIPKLSSISMTVYKSTVCVPKTIPDEGQLKQERPITTLLGLGAQKTNEPVPPSPMRAL
jgi:hypothetical protein